MNIEISTKHIEINEEMKRDIVRKFERLERFFRDATFRLNVEIIKTTGEHHRKGFIFDAQTKLYLACNVIKAGGEGESVLSACDKVLKELERQVIKIKIRNQSNERKNRRTILEIKGKV